MTTRIEKIIENALDDFRAANAEELHQRILNIVITEIKSCSEMAEKHWTFWTWASDKRKREAKEMCKKIAEEILESRLE